MEKYKKPDVKKIIVFLKKNPNPKDIKVHDFAEKMKYDIHKVEDEIYKLATKYIKKR